DTRSGIQREIGLLGMLGIDAVPALGDLHGRCAEESGNVPQDQFIDFFLVEDVDTKGILMRVAECKFAFRRLRYEAVNSPAIILRGLVCNATRESRQRSAHTERRIKTKSQPGGERRAKAPSITLRLRSQHLQLDPGQA